MTLYAVLRALVSGDRLLNDAQWVEKALAAIDAHEAAHQPPAPSAPADAAPVEEWGP